MEDSDGAPAQGDLEGLVFVVPGLAAPDGLKAQEATVVLAAPVERQGKNRGRMDLPDSSRFAQCRLGRAGSTV